MRSKRLSTSTPWTADMENIEQAIQITDRPAITLEELEKMLGPIPSWFPQGRRSKHSKARALRAKSKAKKRKK